MNARTILKTSLVTLSLLVAACTAPTTDDGAEEGSDALKKIGENGGIGEPVGPINPAIPGWPTPPVVRKAPRVMARSASGSNVTVKLDRALAADELNLSKIELLAVRKVGSGFVKKNLATSAALSADKTTLSIALSEPVKSGEIYFPRGEWRPCATSTTGSKCRPRPARFGELIVKSKLTSPLGDIAVLDGITTATLNNVTTSPAPGHALFFNATALSAAPPHTDLVLAADPLPEQGTFRVKSMTPASDATEVDRKTDKVIVTFEGGTIDCSKTGHGQNAFHLHSVSPDVYDQQSMYEDPQFPTPNVGNMYRGHLRCEEDTNRIVFTTPGVLLGDSWFQVDLNVWSKEGNFMGNKVLEFKTKRPGLQVLATRIENHYGGDNTCDNDVFGTNYCDIYVTTAIATAGGGQPSRIPEQGDFGGMKKFADDPVSGSRDLWPNRVLYANANPIDEVVDIQMWAVDADDDSAWKKVFEVAGKVAGAMALALTPIKPEAGAIAEGVSAGFLGLAEVIPTNEDDFLGSGRFIFTASGNRWGTMATGPIVLDLSKNSPDRGPVKVFLRTEELPLSWKLPAPIL
jgi:hypothetical protein